MNLTKCGCKGHKDVEKSEEGKNSYIDNTIMEVHPKKGCSHPGVVLESCPNIVLDNH